LPDYGLVYSNSRRFFQLCRFASLQLGTDSFAIIVAIFLTRLTACPGVKGPLAYGYTTNVWSTARIAEVIMREFGVGYHRDHVGRLMHSLNWSHQKPEKRAVERDEEAIEQWKRPFLPALLQQHRARGGVRLPPRPPAAPAWSSDRHPRQFDHAHGEPLAELQHQHPRLHIEHFPSYAPELNPDEGVWAQAKAGSGQRLPSTSKS
jgi:hypothetical protein